MYHICRNVVLTVGSVSVVVLVVLVVVVVVVVVVDFLPLAIDNPVDGA